MCTGLKRANRRVVGLVIPIVEHGSLVKIFGFNPLQWDPLRRIVGGALKIMAAPNLEPEAVSYISTRLHQNPNIGISMRAYPVSPMIHEGSTVVNHQLHQESPAGPVGATTGGLGAEGGLGDFFLGARPGGGSGGGGGGGGASPLLIGGLGAILGGVELMIIEQFAWIGLSR